MLRTIFASTVALAILIGGAANAGSRQCGGQVQVSEPWTQIVAKDQHDEPCRFKTDSKHGQRILALCPNGSRCLIDLPLPGEPRAAIETSQPKTLINALDVFREKDSQFALVPSGMRLEFGVALSPVT